MLLLGTQIPDRDSLPPGITRNVSARFSLRVADQVADDCFGHVGLQSGYRATRLRAGHFGWGILAGLGKPGARRSFYVNTTDAPSPARSRYGSRPAPCRTQKPRNINPDRPTTC